MSRDRFNRAKKHLRRRTWQPGLQWCQHNNAKYQFHGLIKPHTAVASCVCGYSEFWAR